MSSEGFKIASAFVSVEPDTEGFKEKLQAALDEAVEGVRAAVRVTLDTSELDAKADEAKAKLDDLDGKKATATVGLDDADLSAKADDAKARLDELSGKDAQPTVTLDDSRIVEGLDDIAAKLAELDNSVNDVRLTIEDEGVGEKLDEVKAELEDLGDREARPKLGLDDAEFKEKLAEDKAALDSAGGEGGGGFPTMLAGLAGGIGGLLPGIGGAAAGLGLLGAAGGLALGNVAKTLDAAHQASQNIGITQQQLAATEFSNSVQIQQAQQQIGQAHQQAAQDAVQATQSIESAQMNLASAERNAAASEVQALQSVQQAQQQVEEANYSLSEAQYNLTQAWVQAREQLVALNDQLADSQLNVQSAQLAVQQAEYNQQLADQNAMTTSLQRQEAALAVAQAQQQLKDAQDQATAAQQAANTANQQGVAGSQTVIQAQQAVTQAQYAQTDAVQQYQDSQANLVLTEKNNADQIKQAQMQVASAEEQAAYTQKKDAQAIANAVQNLANTYKEQQLQMAATMASSNQAANQFAKDFANLSGPAQRFVNEVLSMRGAFKQLETATQNAVMPGLTAFLHGIQSLMPEITSGIRQMAGVIGQAFAQFGKVMQTPAFAKTIQGLISNGMQFANMVLPAFAQFVQELMKAGAQKDAVSGLAGLLAGLAQGLTGLVKGIEPFEGALSSIFATLGKALASIGQPLGEVIGALAQALAPALAALLPGFRALVTAVGSTLATALKALAPLLLPTAEAITSIVVAVAPLAPQFAALFAQLAQQLAPLLTQMVPLITQLAQLFAQALSDGLIQVMSAALQLLPPVVSLAEKLLPLISAVIQVSAWLMKLGADINGPVIAALVAINKPIQDVETRIVSLGTHWNTVWTGVKQIALDVYHNAIQPVLSGISKAATTFVSDLGQTWAKLEPIFKTPVNFLINTVYDNGIRRLWDDVVNAIGLGSLDLPDVPGLAGGGIVPGRDRGYDSQLVRMRPGEGVLVPEAVQGIGGAGTVNALNRAYGRVGASTPGGAGQLPAFGGGGVLGAIGSVASSIGNGITNVIGGSIDIGKMVAAIATGNTTAFTNAVAQMIGTPAAGDLAKIMTGIPKTLVSDLAAKLAGSVTGKGSATPGSSSSATGALPANWQEIASFLAGHGFTKFAAAGVAGNIQAESGGDPEILEIGGGGGGGLIQWTPYPPSYITGNVTRDLMTQLNAILSFGGGPALVNKGTSPGNAAAIYQDDYERPASLTASLAERMASANAVYKAMGWGSYDQGGWLTAGTIPVNQTGRPEAVLTPDESTAFKQLTQFVRQMMAGGGRAAGAGMPPVQFIYNGTQQPTAEQRAWQMRDLALALGGAG